MSSSFSKLEQPVLSFNILLMRLIHGGPGSLFIDTFFNSLRPQACEVNEYHGPQACWLRSSLQPTRWTWIPRVRPDEIQMQTFSPAQFVQATQANTTEHPRFNKIGCEVHV